MSDDPILVEVTRGGAVESFHRGAAAVINGDGDVLFSCGDIERPIFPRSAIKPIQALPLVENGAADRLSLSDEELALCCASHGGEPRHVALAAAMLAKVELNVDALACGAHWPAHEPSARALARAGEEPTALHNNCSGKHAGFLCLACDEGEPAAGYERAEHSVQIHVREALEAVLRVSLDEAPAGIDGCAIPAYAVPLRALAAGYARLVSGQGVGKKRATAGRRLLDAAITLQRGVSPQTVVADGEAELLARQLADHDRTLAALEAEIVRTRPEVRRARSGNSTPTTSRS